MSDSNKKSIWENKNMPHLEFCTIERAAKLLGYEIDDFMHWWALNAINLYVYLNGEHGSLSFIDIADLKNKTMKKHHERFKDYFMDSVYYSFIPDKGEGSVVVENAARLYEDSDDLCLAHLVMKGSLHGFWRISAIEECVIFGEKITIDDARVLTDLSCDPRNAVITGKNDDTSIRIENSIITNKSELIIFKKDLYEIINNTGTSFFEDDIHPVSNDKKTEKKKRLGRMPDLFNVLAKTNPDLGDDFFKASLRDRAVMIQRLALKHGIEFDGIGKDTLDRLLKETKDWSV
ncbi:hypothetical protein [Dickeya sp. ws52]|uniref:hypothetical protein n=1 Tax=Dickeya sp. ws52 TaxID=2576377 RepID=UPI001180E758|nr:hypothetical protein [Dickeya sp. ws52]TYL44051.1 hypothetical protein FDP13_04435 [Dickeya sp. ws52]